MLKEKIKKNTGIGLVETIIYIAIFSMIVTTFAYFQNNITTIRLQNQRVLEVNNQGQKAMKVITDTIRRASEVNSPTIANSASNLSLAMNESMINPTVFFESEGILYITEGLGQPISLTNNKVILSDLLFSNYSHPGTPDMIRISFTLTDLINNSNSGNYSFTFNSSAQLRK